MEDGLPKLRRDAASSSYVYVGTVLNGHSQMHARVYKLSLSKREGIDPK